MEVPKELKGAELQCVVGLKDVIIVFVNRWTVLSGRLSNIHISSPGEFHSIHRLVYLVCRYPTRIKHCWVQPIVCTLLVCPDIPAKASRIVMDIHEFVNQPFRVLFAPILVDTVFPLFVTSVPWIDQTFQRWGKKIIQAHEDN